MAYFDDYDYLDISWQEHDNATNSNRPIVTVNKDWIWPNYVLYLDNNNEIIFEKSIPSVDYKLKDYVLINGEEVTIINNEDRE